MWKKLKRSYLQFKEDESGERFLKAHERWKQHSNGPVATILIIAGGTVLIVGASCSGWFQVFRASYWACSVWL